MQKSDTPAGRVRFIAADRADTAVEVLPADASKGRDVKVAEQTTVEYGDRVLRIEASAKNQFLGPRDPSRRPSSCPPVPGSR